jgi:hypothetical protein
MTRRGPHKIAAASPERTAPAAQPQETPLSRRSPIGRLAFRFIVAYLVLFSLATQISGSLIPNLSVDYEGLGPLWPMRDITAWVGRAFLGITSALESSGGEPLFFWVQTLWILILSAAIAVMWWLADRQRPNDTVVYAWFRLFVRLALASQLFEYGMTKVIPTQFPAPSLTTLVTPVGDLTLSALLWTSIGASTPYEIFTGCIELAAGVLLVIPRTSLAGALIGLGALTQVFVLNMTYDIGVKAVSFHLVLLAVVVIAPDIPRLIDFLIRGRPVAPRREPPVARTPRGNRLALAAQLAFGVYLLVTFAYINVSFWRVAGGGQPRPPLYGIWDVETLSIDGETRLPQLADYDRRWRRLIVEAPDRVVFQRTDDSFSRYGATVDSGDRTLSLTKGASRTWEARFRFERPSEERLLLDGDMDGHRIRLQLRRVDDETWRLLNSQFRWIRPHDP